MLVGSNKQFLTMVNAVELSIIMVTWTH